MIDRALVAGIAIGIGGTLILSQLFRESPSFIAIGVGIVLVALAGVAFSDLREERHEELEARRGDR